jgi:hypothetical protein
MDIVERRALPDLVPPSYWGNDAKNIHIVDNFATTEEVKSLNDYVASVTDWTGNQENFRYKDKIHLNIDQSMLPLFDDLFARMKNSIQSVFPVEAIPNGSSICKWVVGDSQPVHADKQEQDGRPNSQQDQDLASVIYINDGSEFEGGELYFPNQSLQIKPKAGMAVFFPGDINYSHGVKTVTSGARYTIPFFWKVICVKHADEKTA